MLTPSTEVKRSVAQRKQSSEPPWKHCARDTLPLSLTAKKFTGNNIWDTRTSADRGDISQRPEEKSFDMEDNNRTDTEIASQPYDVVPCPNKHNSSDTLLKRLANCFAYKREVGKSGTKRHRVLGFYPRLYTIHESASELADDLNTAYSSIIEDKMEGEVLANTTSHYPATKELKDCAFDHGEFNSCCDSNDQKIAALHEDIRELWKRLENVEREFAWARGILVMRNTDANQ